MFEQKSKWIQFLSSSSPVTVIIGLERSRLPGRLVPYPESLEGTTGNVIPCVEVCHVGPIPINAATRHLLVCPTNTSRFHEVGPILTEEQLAAVEAEFSRALGEFAARSEKQRKEAWQRIMQDPQFAEARARAKADAWLMRRPRD